VGATNFDSPADVERFDPRTKDVGGIPVRRTLPRRTHRTVGAWCFADHMGPMVLTGDHQFDVAPHPHIGLQTVTWLRAGEVLHRDSLGTEQPVRAGECNLMTAGWGVSHSEEQPVGERGDVHGLQLWVAQPDTTRNGEPAFEHHAALPKVELEHADATVIVGAFAGTTSPARRDTDHFGAELTVRTGRTTLPLDGSHEHALIVLEGAIALDGVPLADSQLGYVRPGRTAMTIEARDPAVVMLLGGTPFEARIEMFWNYVARTTDEIDAAIASWNADDGRFGTVASPLPRLVSPTRIGAG